MKNSAKNPADRTTTSDGPCGSDHRSAESLDKRGSARLCTITKVKEVK